VGAAVNQIEQALREKAPEAFAGARLAVARQVSATTTRLPDRDAAMRRGRAYIATMGPAIEGQGGNDHTYRVACILRDFGLDESDMLAILADWNAGNAPPWPLEELERFCRNAARYATGAPGNLLLAPSPPAAGFQGPPRASHQTCDRSQVKVEPLVLDPADPLPTARHFVQLEHSVGDVAAIKHHNGIFYAHDVASGAYREHDEGRVRAELYAFLEPTRTPKGDAFRPTKPKIEHVLDALRAVTNLPTAVCPPCWLDDDPGLDPLDMLACGGSLLHIPTRRRIAAGPRFFTLNGLTFAYDPNAPEPSAFLQFLDTLWPDEIESRLALQEWIGYLLTSRTKFQKIAMLVGPKRAGKGTIARVIRRLLGERNVCGPTLSNMAEPFGLSILLGKSLAIISDARISGRADTSTVAERLLAISGEDGISVPRKFLPDYNGKLPTRFMLLTNELPRIEDASGALASRFLVFRLTESFYGREDHGLEERLVPELPGILNWALEGYDRLYARGRFTQPQASEALIRDFEDLGSPISAFVRDRCDVGAGHEVMQQSMFDAWKTWCAENGREHPGTVQTLGRNLRAALPWLNTVQHRVLGQPVRYWCGVRLRDGEAR